MVILSEERTTYRKRRKLVPNPNGSVFIDRGVLQKEVGYESIYPDTINKLSWAGDFAPLLIALAVLVWILLYVCFLQRSFVQPVIFILLLGIGFFLLGPAFVWVVLFMLLGLVFPCTPSLSI